MRGNEMCKTTVTYRSVTKELGKGHFLIYSCFPPRIYTETSEESTEPAETCNTQTSNSESNQEKGKRTNKTSSGCYIVPVYVYLHACT